MFLKDFIIPTDDTVNVEATLQDVIDKMTTNRLHHIVIVDNNKPLAIITERDFVKYYKNNISFDSIAIDFATKNIITLHHSRLLEYALSMMLNNNIRKIVVIDNDDQYIGSIEQEDLIYMLEDKIEKKGIKLSHLTHPGNKAVLINENSTLSYALEVMTSNNLTSLLVTSNNKAVGIISESDVIKLAKTHTSHNKKVKEFMHSPIIQIEEYKTIDDMITLMRNKQIRRVVLFNNSDERYYTLTSKDIAGIIKGNYTSFIESKFFDTRDTFNALYECVIELIDIDDEQVIFWTNSITKANFDINLDDNITKLIDKTTWQKLLKQLHNEMILYETIQIKDQFFQIKGHYGTMNDDKVIKLFLNDVTQIMLLTEQLKKENKIKDKLLFDQAKMVQMGEMISNIAHQWRQPLSVITTITSGLQLKKEINILDDEYLISSLKSVENQAMYLSKTIDTFRNFLKENKEIKEVILQDRIQIALDIVKTALNNNHIKLIDNIAQIEPIKIKIVLGELSQVIINIINNAKDAILENKIKDSWIKIELTKKLDDCILITIEDNAKGIPENIIERVFEAHFTTKDESKGTGLGLSMSKKIITESLNGELYVKNTDNGAKFFIELPIN
jgi:signal transduction histidine kinase/predicted transcriptional regulator